MTTSNIQELNIDDLLETVESEREFYENLKKIIIDSIVNQTYSNLKSDIEKTTWNYEKIFNKLNIEDTNNSACFYFGCLYALTTSFIEICDRKQIDDNLNNVSLQYTHLRPFLELLYEKGTVSGKMVRNELCMSVSSLSNFIKRIEKYKLIEINKIGNMKYYTLSILGNQLIKKYNNSKNENKNNKYIEIKDILNILTGISQEINEENPNPEEIIHNKINFPLTTSEKRLLKQKIDVIFTSRKNYIKNKMKTSLSANLRHNKYLMYSYNSEYLIKREFDEFDVLDEIKEGSYV